MKSLLLSIILSFPLLLSAQEIASLNGDSATVILKNISGKKFKSFTIGFAPQIVGVSNFKSGDSITYKVRVTGEMDHGPVVAYVRKYRYAIQPMDYPDQVSKEILEKDGVYLYLINIKEEEGGYLDIKVEKVFSISK
ncbi:MAG: hypothetical protein NT150_00725 [Bacteroidetes bacterium]|nr:hypothetical protein [Bacteroidota bacterium]